MVRESFLYVDLAAAQASEILRNKRDISREDRLNLVVMSALYPDGNIPEEGVTNLWGVHPRDMIGALERALNAGYVAQSHSSGVAYSLTEKGRRHLEKYIPEEKLKIKNLEENRQFLEELF